MDVLELMPIVEAMIFVAEEPITEAGLLAALEDAGITKEQLREALGAIERKWNEAAEHGIQLSQVAGGYQFRTKERCAEWLRRLDVPKPMRLSGPALETLAIVAYRQPIVRSEIERIRGVDSGAVLKTLLERRLLRIVGRRDEPGQPLLYGTTKEFLEVFDLKTLKELPTLKDIEDLARERKSEAHGGEIQISEGGEGEGLVGTTEENVAEVITRQPIEDSVEGKKDAEVLAGLEGSIKDLRRLERRIFPKKDQGGESDAKATESASQERPGEDRASRSQAQGSSPPDQESDEADAPGSDDCPFE